MPASTAEVREGARHRGRCGAIPDDHDLYLACFGDDGHQILRLLLGHAPDVTLTTALAAPISTDDAEAVRLLLQAGASPSRPLPGDELGDQMPAAPPISPVAAQVWVPCRASRPAAGGRRRPGRPVR